MKLSELIKEYLEVNKLRLAPSTYRVYSVHLKRFAKFTGDCDITDVKPPLIVAYVNYLQSEGMVDNSIATYLWPIRNMMKMAYECYYIDVRGEIVPSIRVDDDIDAERAMAVEDWCAIMEVAKQEAKTGDWRAVRNLAMLTFLGDTWCRVGGMLSLEMPRLALGARTAKLIEKGRKTHNATFSDATVRRMNKWLAARPGAQHNAVWVSGKKLAVLSYDGARYIFLVLAEKAGVTGVCRLHAVRHMAATAAIEAGVPLDVIREKLGHKSAETTLQFYLHASLRRQQEATDVVAKRLKLL
jgi:site-specific recombinase XerD